MALEWKGDALLAKVRKAEEAGLLEHAEAVVTAAQGIVAVDSGDLKGDIAVQQGGVFSTGHGFTAEVGSMDIPYAAIQELGPVDGRPYTWHPYMRPAADRQAPELPGRIAGHMR